MTADSELCFCLSRIPLVSGVGRQIGMYRHGNNDTLRVVYTSV